MMSGKLSTSASQQPMMLSTANLVNKLKENTKPMMMGQTGNLNTSQYLNTTGALEESQTYQQMLHNMTAPLQRGVYPGGGGNNRGASQGPQYTQP